MLLSGPLRCYNSMAYDLFSSPRQKLRSRFAFVRSKDAVDPRKQDKVVHKIPCEWGKVYVGETGKRIYELKFQLFLNTPIRPGIRSGTRLRLLTETITGILV